MKRRLRKKLHLGEFKELGFGLRFRSRDPSAQTHNAAIEAFVAEVERLGLVVGGGGQGCFEGYVTRPSGSATPADRERLTEWLRGCALIDQPEVEPLTDAYWPDGYRGGR